MSDETIKLAIKNIINRETGLTVIFAEQAGDNYGPKPSRRPYCVLRLDTETALGDYDEEGLPDDDGIAIIRGHRTRVVNLDTFGTGCLDQMSNIQIAFNKRSVLDFLSVNDKLSIIDIGPIQNLSGLLETDFEEHASMDLIIGYSVTSEDDVGLIEHVEINSEIIDLV